MSSPCLERKADVTIYSGSIPSRSPSSGAIDGIGQLLSRSASSFEQVLSSLGLFDKLS